MNAPERLWNRHGRELRELAVVAAMLLVVAILYARVDLSKAAAPLRAWMGGEGPSPVQMQRLRRADSAAPPMSLDAWCRRDSTMVFQRTPTGATLLVREGSWNELRQFLTTLEWRVSDASPDSVRWVWQGADRPLRLVVRMEPRP